jgi:hypothetical protein
MGFLPSQQAQQIRIREPKFGNHLRHRQQVGSVFRVRFTLDLLGAALQQRLRWAIEPHQRHPRHHADVARSQEILRRQRPQFDRFPLGFQSRQAQRAAHLVPAADPEGPFRPQHQHQQFGQVAQRAVRRGQVIERLLQRPLLRVGRDLDEDVVRFRLAVQVHAEQAVGQLAALYDLAGHRFDAAHVLEAATSRAPLPWLCSSHLLVMS